MLSKAVLVIFLGAVCIVSARWAVEHRSAGRRYPYWWTSALLVPTLAALFLVLQHSSQESRLEGFAATFTGRPTEVRCQTWSASFLDLGQYAGTVRYDGSGRPERAINLSYDTCDALNDYDGGRPDQDTAVAIHVMAHELQHTLGFVDEAQAECYGMQSSGSLAQMMGATKDEAEAASSTYYTRVYPRVPDAYRSPECRFGGALDLGRDLAPWQPRQG